VQIPLFEHKGAVGPRSGVAFCAAVLIVAGYGHDRCLEQPPCRSIPASEIATERGSSNLPKLEQGITGIEDPPDEEKMWCFGSLPAALALRFPGKPSRSAVPAGRKTGNNTNQNRQSHAVDPLAMAEAYVLAGELNRAGSDYSTAFRRHEGILRPLVEARQKSARYFASGFVPKTGMGVWLRNQATKLTAFRPFAQFFLGRQLRDNFDLPNYEDRVIASR
jgi:hypothetical protein